MEFDIYSLIPEIKPEELEYFKASIPRYKRVYKIFKDIPAGKVLDIGCSPGQTAIILSRMGFDVTGIDLNDLWIPKYNPKWFDEFKRMTLDVEKNVLPFDPNSFDYVIFMDVLEHVAIRHPRDIFREILRVLKPKGMIYMTTPNVSNLSYILTLLRGDNIFWDTEIFYGSTDRHNREYTAGEIKKLLKESGFDNMDVNFYSTWSNNKYFSVRTMQFLINKNFNNRLLDNTIEAVAIKNDNI